MSPKLPLEHLLIDIKGHIDNINQPKCNNIPLLIFNSTFQSLKIFFLPLHSPNALDYKDL